LCVCMRAQTIIVYCFHYLCYIPYSVSFVIWIWCLMHASMPINISPFCLYNILICKKKNKC